MLGAMGELPAPKLMGVDFPISLFYDIFRKIRIREAIGVGIKNQKDFLGGVMFVIFGGLFAAFGGQYHIGTAAKMGPGYFPTALGVIVMLLGIVISAGGLSSRAAGEKVARFEWRVLLLVIGSVLLFSVLLQPLGLVVSLFALIAVSSYASHEFSWKPALINAGVLIVMCLAVFDWALNLHFQVWPAFVGK